MTHVSARIKSWSLAPVAASWALANARASATAPKGSGVCCRRDSSNPSPACRSRISTTRSRRRGKSSRLLLNRRQGSALRRSERVPHSPVHLAYAEAWYRGMSERGRCVQPAGGRAVVGGEDRRASLPATRASGGMARLGAPPLLGETDQHVAPPAPSRHEMSPLRQSPKLIRWGRKAMELARRHRSVARREHSGLT